MKKTTNVKRLIHSIHVKAEKALKKAVSEAIEEHRRMGQPIVVWRQGKVVRIPPSRLKVR